MISIFVQAINEFLILNAMPIYGKCGCSAPVKRPRAGDDKGNDGDGPGAPKCLRI